MHSKSPANAAHNKTVDDVGSNNTVNMPVKQKQRQRTSSMPAENRKVRRFIYKYTSYKYNGLGMMIAP